jgi:hypothetical protein
MLSGEDGCSVAAAPDAARMLVCKRGCMQMGKRIAVARVASAVLRRTTGNTSDMAGARENGKNQNQRCASPTHPPTHPPHQCRYIRSPPSESLRIPVLRYMCTACTGLPAHFGRAAAEFIPRAQCRAPSRSRGTPRRPPARPQSASGWTPATYGTPPAEIAVAGIESGLQASNPGRGDWPGQGRAARRLPYRQAATG